MQKSRGWVELPYCTGGTSGLGDVPLAFDKSNASKATCKTGDPSSEL